MSAASNTRAASHAGTWYSDDATELNRQLSGWIANANVQVKHARAIIAPHAGYSYSGPTAGHAYASVDASTLKRVFILGPSHHAHIDGVAVSCVTSYETPLGNLQADTAVISALLASGEVDSLDRKTDEDDHCIEMHLPFVAHLTAGTSVSVVSLLVGELSKSKKEAVATLLAPYLDDSASLFVISSDFCHWGRRFSFTFYDESAGAIHESIEALDRAGMAHIEACDGPAFDNYIKVYRNTICGRKPISLLLHMMTKTQTEFLVRFTHYAQSSKCKKSSDSSVSYASAAIVPK